MKLISVLINLTQEGYSVTFNPVTGRPGEIDLIMRKKDLENAHRTTTLMINNLYMPENYVINVLLNLKKEIEIHQTKK